MRVQINLNGNTQVKEILGFEITDSQTVLLHEPDDYTSLQLNFANTDETKAAASLLLSCGYADLTHAAVEFVDGPRSKMRHIYRFELLPDGSTQCTEGFRKLARVDPKGYCDAFGLDARLCLLHKPTDDPKHFYWYAKQAVTEFASEFNNLRKLADKHGLKLRYTDLWVEKSELLYTGEHLVAVDFTVYRSCTYRFKSFDDAAKLADPNHK